MQKLLCDIDLRMFLAFVLQATFFGLFFFIDARMTVAETWQSVLRFGLNPLVVLFFGLTPLVLWWSYRQVLATVGSFWLATMIQGAVLQAVYIFCSYLGSKQKPTIGEAIGLMLSMTAVIVAGVLNRRLS
jgi:hypothetical protein